MNLPELTHGASPCYEQARPPIGGTTSSLELTLGDLS